MVSRGDAMKTVVVTGSRKWSEPAPLRAALQGADVLIVGDCPPDRTTRSSADSLAMSIALRWDVVVQVFAASTARAKFLRNKGIHVELISDWERDGNSAGPTRNTAIADAARRARLLGEVHCYAFPQPGSVGTYDCIQKLRSAGLDVDVFRGSPNTPSYSAHASAVAAAPELLLFWGHKPSAVGVIGPECLSQWYPAPFVISGDRFPTAEHYMMHRKALLFGDRATAESILLADRRHQQKSSGGRLELSTSALGTRTACGLLSKATSRSSVRIGLARPISSERSRRCSSRRAHTIAFGASDSAPAIHAPVILASGVGPIS